MATKMATTAKQMIKQVAGGQQIWVELRGLEPLTPTLPVWCATSCATAPYRPRRAELRCYTARAPGPNPAGEPGKPDPNSTPKPRERHAEDPRTRDLRGHHPYWYSGNIENR